MSTTSSVCQGTQPRLEPLLLQPNALTSQLDSSYKSDLSSFPWRNDIQFTEGNQMNSPFQWKNNKKGEFLGGCRYFLQSLTRNFRQFPDDLDQVYVHPLDKPSNYSLDMCTESLGSETGSNMDSNTDELSSLVQSFHGTKQLKTREFPKKIKHSSSFPPPLTSISGKDSVQVQSHREGGRLVIKAFNSSPCSTYFQAVREKGRLRLSLHKADCRDCHHELSENEKDEEEEEKTDNIRKPEKEVNEMDDEADFFCADKVTEGGKVGCEIGDGEWCSNWCKGDGKKMPSLPLCVAIS